MAIGLGHVNFRNFIGEQAKMKNLMKVSLVIYLFFYHFALFAEDVTFLTPNESYSDTAPDNMMRYYQVISEDYSKLTISITSNDEVDFYVRQGELPSQANEYDCHASTNGSIASCQSYLPLPASSLEPIFTPIYIGVVGFAQPPEPLPPSPECELDPFLPECEDPCFFDPFQCGFPEVSYQIQVDAIGNTLESNEAENVSEPFDPLGYGEAETLVDGDWDLYKISPNDQGLGNYSLLLALQTSPDATLLETYPNTDEIILYAKNGTAPTESEYDCKISLANNPQNCQLLLDPTDLDTFVAVRYKDDPTQGNNSSLQGQYKFTIESVFQGGPDAGTIVPILDLLLED